VFSDGSEIIGEFELNHTLFYLNTEENLGNSLYIVKILVFLRDLFNKKLYKLML
jgi:hypothetical protein